MLKQNENNLFHARPIGNRSCLWFLWCDDLVCDWLNHNKHSRHILRVHANMITTVKLSTNCVVITLQKRLVEMQRFSVPLARSGRD